MLSNTHENKNSDSQQLKFSTNIMLLSLLILLLSLKVCKCNNIELKPKLSTKIFKIDLTQQQIPIVSLAKFSSQFTKVDLILDTGSSQIALFDSQCYECLYTLSFCPHIKSQSNQTFLNYFSAKFHGDYSYLNLSDTLRFKFFCVLRVQSQQNIIKGNGILGINMRNNKVLQKDFKQSSGIKIWKKIIQKVYQKEFQASQGDLTSYQTSLMLKYAIFYTPFHTLLILGDLPEYVSKVQLAQLQYFQPLYYWNLNFFNQQQHQQQQQQQQLNGADTNQKNYLQFDSGSNVIVLPKNIFNNLLKNINDKVSLQCKIGNSRMIQCPKYLLSSFIQLKFQMKFQIFQKVNKKFNLSISFLNLVERDFKKEQYEIFRIKIISHSDDQTNLKGTIIMGIPIFKQYVIQYEVPLERQSKEMSQKIKLQVNKKEYKIRVFDNRGKDQNELISEYENLLKKYRKNIKMFIFFYIFMVGFISYVGIQINWWLDRSIKGTRTIV